MKPTTTPNACDETHNPPSNSTSFLYFSFSVEFHVVSAWSLVTFYFIVSTGEPLLTTYVFDIGDELSTSTSTINIHQPSRTSTRTWTKKKLLLQKVRISKCEWSVQRRIIKQACMEKRDRLDR